MPRKQLGQPILDGEIRSTNFFNGRLLTAEDLQVEQEAQRAHRLRLGQALGAGVTTGLDVAIVAGGARGKEAAVRVRGGLAFNRLGGVICLPVDTEVVITPTRPASHGTVGTFMNVQPPALQVRMGNLTLAVLVLSPVTILEGQAPMSGPRAGGVLIGSQPRNAVDGVQFQLLPCTLPFEVGDFETLRSRIAHLCFGSGDQVGAERLCPLSDVDVPLAVICSCDGEIRFVDTWSVRGAGSPEAVAGQFQAQLADLQATGNCSKLNVRQHFSYLPPVGYLPLGPGGFQWTEFFWPLPVEKIDLDPAFVRSWIEQARLADPIDLGAPSSLWVFAPEGATQAIFMRRERARVIQYANAATVMVDVRLPGRQMLLDPSSVEVYAADSNGNRYSAETVGASFVIPALPPGDYSVWTGSKGYRTVGEHRSLVRGETVHLYMELAPGTRAPSSPAPADHSAPARWINPGCYDTMTINVGSLNWGTLPERMQAWTLLENLPPGAVEWLKAWGNWLGVIEPEMPILVEKFRVLLDSAHSPEKPAPSPYMVVVYGDGGAFLALELTPVGQGTGPQPVEPPGILEPPYLGNVAAGQQPDEGGKPPWLRRVWAWMTDWS